MGQGPTYMQALCFDKAESDSLHAQAPLTNQHYSVDMFLAVVVTALVWHWCAPANMLLDCGAVTS